MEWKMTNRSTWDKEWEHKKTRTTINVSSEVNYASGWRTICWTLELNTPSKRFIVKEDSWDLGDLSGEYITPEDRIVKNKFIQIAKKIMKESDKFTTIKQFHELTKKYKK